MPNRKRLPKLMMATALCLLTVMMGHALALRMYYRANTNAQVYTGDTPVYLKLNNSGDTVMRFRTQRLSKVFLWFNAECTAEADASTVPWVNIDIILDGVVIKPSDGDNAFCTAHGTGSLDQWVSASTNGATRIQPGVHTLRVRANHVLGNANSSFRIDDTILQVLVEKF